MNWRIRQAHRAPRDEGTVTAFVVVFVLALILLAGLVLDGGLALAARVQAIDEAQAAARAGAQAVSLTTLRSDGHVVLDPVRARAAAFAYLAATGHTGTVRVVGNQVQVAVTITQPTQILGIAGVHRFVETGHGSATPVEGVTGAGP